MHFYYFEIIFYFFTVLSYHVKHAPFFFRSFVAHPLRDQYLFSFEKFYLLRHFSTKILNIFPIFQEFSFTLHFPVSRLGEENPVSRLDWREFFVFWRGHFLHYTRNIKNEVHRHGRRRLLLDCFKSFVHFYESTLNCNISVNTYSI